MKINELKIETPSGPLACALCQPATRSPAACSKLLLTFAGSRHSALHEAPQDIPARLWAEAGLPVASFDLPCHGGRVEGYGEGISGLCAAFLAGDDPFLHFVADGQALIDALLEMGLGGGGIALAGVSRAAYCVLRLAVADVRVDAVAALAPVTDWRRLTEFAAVRQRADVAGLALQALAPALAGRALFLAIGNRDRRVGTDACVALAQHIYAAEAEDAQTQSRLRLHVVDAPDHTLPETWRRAGAQFLLDHMDGGAPAHDC